jgi:hypothetical protein
MRRSKLNAAAWIGLIFAVAASLYSHFHPLAARDKPITGVRVLPRGGIELEAPASSTFEFDSALARRTAPPQATRPQGKPSNRGLYGVVRDVAGNPIPGVIVGHGDFSTAVKTDTDGRYRLSIDLDREERFVVRYLRSGYEEGSHTVLSDGPPSREIERSMILERSDETVSVRGRIVDENGTAVAGQQVRITSWQIVRHYMTRSEPDGTYEFEGVRRGKYDLAVFPQGPYTRYKQTGLDVSETTQDLDASLKSIRLGLLPGEALDSEGAPLSFFSFKAHSSSTPNRPHLVETDAFGQFEIEQAAVGRWVIAARNDGYFRLSNVVFDSFLPSPVQLVFDIGPFELSGWVLDRSSNPVAGASVELTRADGYWGVKRTSRRVVGVYGDGRFLIPKLAMGAYRVTVAANGYSPISMNYHVGQRSDQPHFVLLKN